MRRGREKRRRGKARWNEEKRGDREGEGGGRVKVSSNKCFDYVLMMRRIDGKRLRGVRER